MSSPRNDQSPPPPELKIAPGQVNVPSSLKEFKQLIENVNAATSKIKDKKSTEGDYTLISNFIEIIGKIRKSKNIQIKQIKKLTFQDSARSLIDDCNDIIKRKEDPAKKQNITQKEFKELEEKIKNIKSKDLGVNEATETISAFDKALTYLSTQKPIPKWIESEALFAWIEIKLCVCDSDPEKEKIDNILENTEICDKIFLDNKDNKPKEVEKLITSLFIPSKIFLYTPEQKAKELIPLALSKDALHSKEKAEEEKEEHNGLIAIETARIGEEDDAEKKEYLETVLKKIGKKGKYLSDKEEIIAKRNEKLTSLKSKIYGYLHQEKTKSLLNTANNCLKLNIDESINSLNNDPSNELLSTPIIKNISFIFNYASAEKLINQSNLFDLIDHGPSTMINIANSSPTKDLFVKLLSSDKSKAREYAFRKLKKLHKLIENPKTKETKEEKDSGISLKGFSSESYKLQFILIKYLLENPESPQNQTYDDLLKENEFIQKSLLILSLSKFTREKIDGIDIIEDNDNKNYIESFVKNHLSKIDLLIKTKKAKITEEINKLTKENNKIADEIKKHNPKGNIKISALNDKNEELKRLIKKLTNEHTFIEETWKAVSNPVRFNELSQKIEQSSSLTKEEKETLRKSAEELKKAIDNDHRQAIENKISEIITDPENSIRKSFESIIQHIPAKDPYIDPTEESMAHIVKAVTDAIALEKAEKERRLMEEKERLKAEEKERKEQQHQLEEQKLQQEEEKLAEEEFLVDIEALTVMLETMEQITSQAQYSRAAREEAKPTFFRPNVIPERLEKLVERIEDNIKALGVNQTNILLPKNVRREILLDDQNLEKTIAGKIQQEEKLITHAASQPVISSAPGISGILENGKAALNVVNEPFYYEEKNSKPVAYLERIGKNGAHTMAILQPLKVSESKDNFAHLDLANKMYLSFIRNFGKPRTMYILPSEDSRMTQAFILICAATGIPYQNQSGIRYKPTKEEISDVKELIRTGKLEKEITISVDDQMKKLEDTIRQIKNPIIKERVQTLADKIKTAIEHPSHAMDKMQTLATEIVDNRPKKSTFGRTP